LRCMPSAHSTRQCATHPHLRLVEWHHFFFLSKARISKKSCWPLSKPLPNKREGANLLYVVKRPARQSEVGGRIEKAARLPVSDNLSRSESQAGVTTARQRAGSLIACRVYIIQAEGTKRAALRRGGPCWFGYFFSGSCRLIDLPASDLRFQPDGNAAAGLAGANIPPAHAVHACGVTAVQDRKRKFSLTSFSQSAPQRPVFARPSSSPARILPCLRLARSDCLSGGAWSWSKRQPNQTLAFVGQEPAQQQRLFSALFHSTSAAQRSFLFWRSFAAN